MIGAILPKDDLAVSMGVRSSGVPKEVHEDISAAGYDADYVLENDKPVNLEKGAPRQVTETSLMSDRLWVESARRLMPLFSAVERTEDNAGDFDAEGNLTDEAAAQWGLEAMGWFNYNIPSMGYMTAKLQSAPNDQKLALYYMMQLYDEKEISWNGAKRLFWGLVWDPSTYFGLTTLGVGALLGAGAKQATKSGFRQALRASLPATVVAGIEGGAYSSLDDALRQEVAMEAGAQKEFDVGRNVQAAGIGTVLGGGLGAGAGVAPEVIRQGGQAISNIARDAQQGTMFSGIPTRPSARQISEADRVVADDLVNRPELWGEDAPDINERRELVDAMLRGERFEGEEGVARLFNDHAERLSIEQAEPAPVFYSAVANAVDALPMDKGNASQMRAMIAKSAEVKPEEMAWIGLDDFLKGKKSVTKQEIKDFVDANQVRIEEVVKDLDDNLAGDERLDLLDMVRDGEISQAEYNQRISDLDRGLTKFSDYTLPGGENYREVLLRLPSNEPVPITKLPDGYEVAPLEGHPTAKYTLVGPSGVGSPVGGSTLEEATAQAIERLSIDPPKSPEFTGGHYDEPNVLAHMRLNDRTGPNGEKILFVEEIQSDWHQKGRKQGYRGALQKYEAYEDMPRSDLLTLAKWNDRNGDWDEATTEELVSSMKRMDAEDPDETTLLNHWNAGGVETSVPISSTQVPDAPLKKTWHEMSFRRIARMAAEEGYDAVAWTPGKLQAERYDLSEQIDELFVAYGEPGTVNVSGTKDGKGVLRNTAVELSKLDEVVGKDIADKIRKHVNDNPPNEDVARAEKRIAELKAQTSGDITGRGNVEQIKEFMDLNMLIGSKSPNSLTLSGLDLQIGGEGMKGFYDKMLKGYAAKWGKKFGAKVGVTEIGGGGKLTLTNPGADDFENAMQKAASAKDESAHQKLLEALQKYEKGQRPRNVFSGLTSDEIKKYIPSAISGGGGSEVWSLPVTKKMRGSVLGKGVATFGAAGVAAGLNDRDARPNGN